MAKQSFVTGQVLTAAQLTSLQQTAMSGGAASAKTASYTLVAADAGTAISMTSTSATTITVNTGLFAAGDTVFIQNLGTANCTITAGTATVNTAGSLILPQYDAGILYFVSASSAVFYDYIQVGAASPLTTKGDLYTFSTSDTRLGVGANGTTLVADSAEATGLKWAAPAASALTKISKTSFSGASSYSISDCFSATYDNYLIMFTDWVNSTGDSNINFLLRSGSTNQTSNYLGNFIDMSGATVVGYSHTTSIISAFHSNTNKAGGIIHLHNPYLSKATNYEVSTSAATNPRLGGGVHTTASSYASLGITISANTSSGDVTIYGYSI